MSAVRTGTQTLANGTYYRIKVKGVLEPVWSERLGGLELSSWQGETTLSGYVGDQAALHGLLMQIRDLWLPLLLVQEIDSENHRRKEAKMSDSFRLQPPEVLVSCVIADEVTVAANTSVKDKEETNRQNILKAGGKINELTPAQRQQWVDAMKPVWKKFESDIGADIIAAAAAS